MGMTLDEIAMKISEEEDNLIAKAFTMQIATLLRQNGIIPIVTRTEATHKIEHVKSNYIFSKEFGVSFNELNCEEHDRIVYSKAIDDYMNKLCNHCMQQTNECYKLECPFCTDGCDIVNIGEQLKKGAKNE